MVKGDIKKVISTVFYLKEQYDALNEIEAGNTVAISQLQQHIDLHERILYKALQGTEKEIETYIQGGGE